MAKELEESWVEAEDESGEVFISHNSSPPRNKATRNRRRPTKSPEPEFVMPSLDSDTLEASWADNTRRASSSPRKSPPRRRMSRQPAAPILLEYNLERKPKGKSPAPKEAQDHLEAVLNHAGTMMSHLLDIMGRALRLLKTPLSIALAAVLLYYLSFYARSLFVSSLYSSVAPLCAIPGASLLGLPFCPSPRSAAGGGPAEFDQLMTIQGKFEDVLKETAVGVTLPIDMKRSEASIRDLRQLVKYSNLQSKNELGLEFDGFVETAKLASRDLTRFNSHIGRAVDQVLSTSRWTTRVIDDMRIHEESRGSISTFTDRLLAPFQAKHYSEVALLDQYIKHAEIVEEQIHKLISEAHEILGILVNLEDRLEIIMSIVTRDNQDVTAKKEEILAELWTIVGGNKGKLSKMDNQLSLLNQVNTYRATAIVHVSLTITKLEEIQAGLEDLRERVGAPGNLRDSHHIPLAVHLENIQLGVQRLEDSRNREKKTEQMNLDRSIRGAYASPAIDG